MSLASILDFSDDILFPEIKCGTLNVDTINANVINGGGGGNGTSITSSDGSITVVNGTGTSDLKNAGQNWAKFSANAEVNMSGNAIQNLASFTFSSFSTASPLTMYQGYTGGKSLNGVYISDAPQGSGGNTGNIYDSKFNKPALSDVLIVGDGGNKDIKNVRTVTANYELSAIADGTTESIIVLGNADRQHIGSSCSWQLLHDKDSNDCMMQYYDTTGLQGTIAKFDRGGVIYLGSDKVIDPQLLVIGSGGATGRVYDTLYNKPPTATNNTTVMILNGIPASGQNVSLTQPTLISLLNATNPPANLNRVKLDISSCVFQLDNSHGSGIMNKKLTFYLSTTSTGAFDRLHMKPLPFDEPIGSQYDLSTVGSASITLVSTTAITSVYLMVQDSNTGNMATIDNLILYGQLTFDSVSISN